MFYFAPSSTPGHGAAAWMAGCSEKTSDLGEVLSLMRGWFISGVGLGWLLMIF